MQIEEIELEIEGTLKEIEELLLNNNFKIFHKVRTVTKYYFPDNEILDFNTDIKSKCKRLRWVCPLEIFDRYEEYIKKYDIAEEIKKEQEIQKEGYHLIYTDDKTDFVYMLDNKLAFQIQDIKNDCLMLAYDNKEYYEYNKEIQRKLLINDVEKFGIKIKDYNNINRFRLLQNN